MRVVKSAYEFLITVSAVIAGLMILFLMLSVSVDVIGRYFLGRPVGWVLEVAEILLLYIPFLAMAWLVRRKGGHVRIDLVVQALKPKARSILNLLSSLAVAVASAVAAYWATVTTLDHHARNVMTVGIYPVEKYLLLSVIAWGLALTTIESLLSAGGELRRLHGGEAPPPTTRPRR